MASPRFSLLVAASLIGCADPVLDPLSEALGAWQAGVAHMAAGDPAAALQRFQAARQADPQSPSLCAWEARALGATGDAAGALLTLNGCIDRRLPAPLLLHERAATLARSGDIEAAAADLQVLIRLGAATPRSLGQDPDLEALRDHPSYPGLVITAQPTLQLGLHPAAVLVGEPWELELHATDAPNPESLRLGGGEGLAFDALIEDQAEGSDPTDGARLTLRGRALGPSEAPVGPIGLALADGRSADAGPFSISRVRLGGLAEGAPIAPARWPSSVPMPSAAQRIAPRAQIGRTGAWLLVGGEPGATPRLSPPSTQAIHLELRADGQPVYSGLAVPAGTKGQVELGLGPDGRPRLLDLP